MLANELLVINRPETDPPRWNLTATAIGREVLMLPLQDPTVPPELSLAEQRQAAVLDSLSRGISQAEQVASYAAEAHQVKVAPHEVRGEVAAAKRRYGARTTFQAVSFAICDGSVPIDEQPWRKKPAYARTALRLLASGEDPDQAIMEAVGGYEWDEAKIQHEWQGVCELFDAQSRYMALRRGFEYGIIPRAVFMPVPKPAPAKVVLPAYTAARQIVFTLPPKDIQLTPQEQAVGRWRAAGLSADATARMLGIARWTFYEYQMHLHAKLSAAYASEAVTKMRVLGLADRNLAIHLRPNEDITESEVRILTGVAQGFSNVEIGGALDLSEGVINGNISTVLRKLGANDRAGAVVCMFETGVFKAG